MKRLTLITALAASFIGLVLPSFASNTTARWSGTVPGLGRLYFSELGVDTLEITGTTYFDTISATQTTFINGEILANASDHIVTLTADDNTSEILDFQLRSSMTSPNDAQTMRISGHSYNDDSDGTYIEWWYMDCVYDDVSSATEDATLKVGVRTAGTLAAELCLNGAAIWPNVEGGLTLGKSGNAWGNAFFNGTITATSGTATFGTATFTAFTLGASGTKAYSAILTSATITAGATSCALTLPTGYAQANHRVQWSIIPATAGNTGYAGHADDYFVWEGGTAAEVRVTSATTKTNLVVEVLTVKTN